MSSDSNANASLVSQQDASSDAKTARWWRVAKIATALLLAGNLLLVCVMWWRLQQLSDRLTETQWSNVVQSVDRHNDIKMDVGSIQFIGRGMAITINSINYKADGVHILGTIGNVANIDVSSVTLNVKACYPIYKQRDKFLLVDHDDRQWTRIWDREEIGLGQSETIPIILAGDRQRFEVTIPNVKQSDKEVEFVAYMTNERYGFKAFPR